MTAPGFDVYGVTLIGAPMIAIGFNEHLGWTHTVNTFDGADLYELQLTASGTYRLDGREVEPVIASRRLLVRNAQGDPEEQTLTTSESVFGPIVATNGDSALAVRIAGLDRPLILSQYVDMARATSRAEFTAALSRGQMPMFNTIYADADGEIAYFFNAAMPRRPSGDWRFWQGVVPGNTSEYLWTDYHAYADLPQFANPESGFVQNANDPPWTSTFPQALDPADYPDYFAAEGMAFRPQRSARLVLGDNSISFAELTDYADDTTMELAVRILPQLVDRLAASDDERAQRAAEVLGNWDGSADADSRGAVLFISWINSLRSPLFADAWDAAEPLATPGTLAATDGIVSSVAATVDAMEAASVPLDAPFGDVFRLRYAGRDLPASAGPGGLGAFRVGDYRPDGDGSYSLVGGNTFVAAVEFGDRVRARGYLGYGNSTQQGSEYAGDQLELFSAGEWRDIHFYSEDIAEHTQRTERLSAQ
jgi:acyl-homoserine-lactone acylase